MMEKIIKISNEEYLKNCKYFDWEKDCFCKILGIEYKNDSIYIHTDDDPVLMLTGPALKGMLQHMMGLR